MTTTAGTVNNQQCSPYSIADELCKFAKLREQGSISEEEFNELKQNTIRSNTGSIDNSAGTIINRVITDNTTDGTDAGTTGSGNMTSTGSSNSNDDNSGGSTVSGNATSGGGNMTYLPTEVFRLVLDSSCA